jgi:hypothetical protein
MKLTIAIIGIVIIMIALLAALGCFSKPKKVENPIPWPPSIIVFKWILFVIGVGGFITVAILSI